MENNQAYNELELMRQQMEDFKEQLDRQKIINEQQAVRSVKKSMSWIKSYVIFEIFLVPIVGLAWYGIKEFAHLSWQNYIFLMLMLTASVVADYIINVSAIKDNDYSHNNLLTTITKLVSMKRKRFVAMIAEMGGIVVWLLWSGMEAWLNMPTDAPDFVRGAINGGLIGGVVGGIIGISFAMGIYRKMQHTNDEAIRQISELNDDGK